MSNNKRSGGIFSGKGYYIALILCAVAIGITGYVYHRNTTQEEAVSLEETLEEKFPVLAEVEEDVPALATQPQQTQTEPAAKPPVQNTVPAQKKTLKTMSPVSSGEEIWGYSMEALSYNQTTRDWRVHNGVDIAAEEGTPVCAAADGVVQAAYEDDALGFTVEILHDGGYITRYASLDREISVETGDAVYMGQVIGCVGSTALVENTLGSHVHFSVSHQDKPMDPAEFLALGSGS